MAEGRTDKESFASFTVHRAGTTVRVIVSGEIDVASAPALKEECVKAMHEKPDQLVIDLGDVSFCDSSGLHALLFVRVEGEALGVPVTVGNLSQQALRILDLSGLTEYLRGAASAS